VEWLNGEEEEDEDEESASERRRREGARFLNFAERFCFLSSNKTRIA
jgi:hypothetical protein